MKERKHAEIIRAWADGADVQYRSDPTMPWKDCIDPAFVEDYDYRVKPVEPKRVYPKTMIDACDLVGLYEKVLNARGTDGGRHAAVLAIANASLCSAIDLGQVVTREEFDRVCKEKDAREVEIVSRIKKAYDEGSDVIIRAKA